MCSKEKLKNKSTAQAGKSKRLSSHRRAGGAGDFERFGKNPHRLCPVKDGYQGRRRISQLAAGFSGRPGRDREGTGSSAKSEWGPDDGRRHDFVQLGAGLFRLQGAIPVTSGTIGGYSYTVFLSNDAGDAGGNPAASNNKVMRQPLRRRVRTTPNPSSKSRCPCRRRRSRFR